MLYIISRNGEYFTSGSSGYVNSTGYCQTPTWVPSIHAAWGTTSKDLAESVVSFHGGVVQPYK